MLGGLGFVFAGRLQIGDQRDMDKQGVARACFMSDLTDGLDKGLALYITDGPADLGDHDISFCFTADIVDEAFDLVWGMVCTVVPRYSPRRSLEMTLE